MAYPFAILCAQVKSITCDHGVALIQRLQQSQPDAEDVALKLAQACTLQDWVKPTYYCCTKVLAGRPWMMMMVVVVATAVVMAAATGGDEDDGKLVMMVSMMVT